MCFDGAVNVLGNGARVVIIFPEKKQYLISVRLHHQPSMNIIGLGAALELRNRKLDVYGDSLLIIYQVKGE